MRTSKYTKELLTPIVADSCSWAEVLKKLDLHLTGGNYRNIQGHVRHHCLDTRHFTGKGWARGKTKHDDARIKGISEKNSYVVEDVLVKNSRGNINAGTLRRLAKNAGIPYTCANGHGNTWMGKPLTLHLDHINGTSNDNRVENLRFLCPNCHQQTPTWGNQRADGQI